MVTRPHVTRTVEAAAERALAASARRRASAEGCSLTEAYARETARLDAAWVVSEATAKAAE